LRGIYADRRVPSVAIREHIRFLAGRHSVPALARFHFVEIPEALIRLFSDKLKSTKLAAVYFEPAE
jgi:hypothetical protein